MLAGGMNGNTRDGRILRINAVWQLDVGTDCPGRSRLARSGGEMELQEHNRFVLTSDVTGDDGEELKHGDVGVIIHIHPGAKHLLRSS